ncbi:MAG: hypothetical protein KDD60_08410, partial [Bdellovibrionales bacterium]|nr:hypothetical protein [Bdellovibrionales bacterium]
EVNAQWVPISGVPTFYVGEVTEDQLCRYVSGSGELKTSATFKVIANQKTQSLSNLEEADKRNKMNRHLWVPNFGSHGASRHGAVDINLIKFPEVTLNNGKNLKPANIPGEEVIPCRIGGAGGVVGYQSNLSDENRAICMALSTDSSELEISDHFEVLYGPLPGIGISNGITIPPGAIDPSPLNSEIGSMCATAHSNAGVTIGALTASGTCRTVSPAAPLVIETSKNQLIFHLLYRRTAEGNVGQGIAPLGPTTGFEKGRSSSDKLSGIYRTNGNSQGTSAPVPTYTTRTQLSEPIGNISAATRNSNSCLGEEANLLLLEAQQGALYGRTIATTEDSSYLRFGSEISYQVDDGVYVSLCSLSEGGVRYGGTLNGSEISADAWIGAYLESTIGIYTEHEVGFGVVTTTGVEVNEKAGAYASGSGTVGFDPNEKVGMEFQGGCFAKAAYGVAANGSIGHGNNTASAGAGVDGPGSVGADVGGVGMYEDGVIAVGAKMSVGVGFVGVSVDVRLTIDTNDVADAVQLGGAEALNGTLYVSGKISGESVKIAYTIKDGTMIAAYRVSDATYNAAQATADGVLFATSQVVNGFVLAPELLESGAYTVRDGVLYAGKEISSFAEGTVFPVASRVGDGAVFAAYSIKDLGEQGAFAVVGLGEQAFSKVSYAGQEALSGVVWTYENIGKLGEKVATKIVDGADGSIHFVEGAADDTKEFFGDFGRSVGSIASKVGNAIKNFFGF